MLRRFLIVLLPTFATTLAHADPSAWNCAEGKDGKWVCVDEKKPASPSSKPAEEEKTPKSTVAVEPLPAEKPEPITQESAQTKETPAPEPAQVVVPATPKVNDTAQTATPEPAAEIAKPEERLPEPAVPVAKKPTPEAEPVNLAKANGPQTKRSGWNCNSKAKTDNWNCVLIGADPKGEAQVVEAQAEESGSGFSLLSPAYDRNQEQIFKSLSSNLKYDPWKNCNAPRGTQRPFVSTKDLRNSSPLDVTSDYSEIYDNEIGSYYGNVDVNRADQHSVSNAASYDSVSETLDMQGDVYYSDDDLALYSHTATLKLATNQAKLRDTVFIAPATPIRGVAKTIYQDSKTLSRYKDVSYTSCPPGNQDWVLHASELKMNKTSGQGSTKNTWLEFKGVPVFYSPYLAFPIDNRRVTGFLAPTFGRTQKGGFNFATPFYWNIASNIDATLTPRYLTKRGILLGGEFRYLTESSNGKDIVDFLPNDNITNKARYLFSAKNNTRLLSKVTSNFDLNYVSDKNFFSELGSALSFPSSSYVRSIADVKYLDTGVSLVSRVENYQTIDNALSGARRPYKRLPQIALNLDHTFQSIPVNTALDSEYVYFQHNSLPYGQRFNVKPSISFPLHTAAAYITPKASLQHTQYFLNNNDVNSVTNAPTGKPNNISRTLPIFSVDSGLQFERDINLGSSALRQTLEPRLFYLYIPKASQGDIPLFDSSLYDFWYNNLFRENRFSGTDRVQDANQVTAAISSRILDSKTGKERLKMSLGEIFYFRNREVTAPVLIGQYCFKDKNTGTYTCQQNQYLDSPIETNRLSPLVGELSGTLNDHFSFDSGLQWDPHSNAFVRGKSVLHFVNNPGEIFNIGYLYRKNNLIRDTLEAHNLPLYVLSNTNNPNDAGSFPIANPLVGSNDIRQFDTSIRWPIYDDWYGIGHWQYSLLYNKTQESFIGLEKENCCWRFRIIGRRYVNNIGVNNTVNPLLSTEATSQTGVFFQFELKGLTGIGEKLDNFFEQSIYGYGKTKQ